MRRRTQMKSKRRRRKKRFPSQHKMFKVAS